MKFYVKPRKAAYALAAADMGLIILIFNLATIPLLSPAGQTADRTPEFSWGGAQGNFILMIDEDHAFGSPDVADVSGNSYIPSRPLEFGTYYWKVLSPAGISSATGMVTVVSEVAVERGNGWLRNSGNTEIILESQPDSEGMTGMLVGIGQTVGIGSGNVTAKQA